ncbi:MAG: Lrp/AsnC family transcriptional regulator [Paracoccaceae bacterium]
MTLALDDRDIQILQILSREGRISKTELARRINLSPTPCWERMKRLEEAGLIRGYRAEIALSAFSRHVTVFVTAELESHRVHDFERFERAVARHDGIVGCWALGGGFDYLLQVVQPDIDSYQRMMDDLLSAEAGLKRYFTYVVTKEVKTGGVPPLAHMLDPQKD